MSIRDNDIVILQTKHVQLQKSILNLLDFSFLINDSTQIEDILVRLETLSEVWVQYQSIEDVLSTDSDDSRNCSILEEMFYQAKANFRRHIKQREPIKASLFSRPHSASTSVPNHQLTQVSSLFQRNQSADIRLPRITIETSAGDYQQWHSFATLFQDSVDSNEQLSAAQKLQYLKRFLKGDALALIRHIPTTNSHYGEAWEKLVNPYGKSIHNLIDKPIIRDTIYHKNINNKLNSSVIYLKQTDQYYINSIQFICDTNSHTITKCSKFINLSLLERRQLSAKLNLCFDCLKQNHSRTQFLSK